MRGSITPFFPTPNETLPESQQQERCEYLLALLSKDAVLPHLTVLSRSGIIVVSLRQHVQERTNIHDACTFTVFLGEKRKQFTLDACGMCSTAAKDVNLSQCCMTVRTVL